MVSACVLNAAPGGKKKRKAIQPTDIFPLLRDKANQVHQEEMSIEDQVKILGQIFGTSPD